MESRSRAKKRICRDPVVMYREKGRGGGSLSIKGKVIQSSAQSIFKEEKGAKKKWEKQIRGDSPHCISVSLI